MPRANAKQPRSRKPAKLPRSANQHPGRSPRRPGQSATLGALPPNTPNARLDQPEEAPARQAASGDEWPEHERRGSATRTNQRSTPHPRSPHAPNQREITLESKARKNCPDLPTTTQADRRDVPASQRRSAPCPRTHPMPDQTRHKKHPIDKRRASKRALEARDQAPLSVDQNALMHNPIRPPEKTPSPSTASPLTVSTARKSTGTGNGSVCSGSSKYISLTTRR